jgi:hypothetical protein
MRRKEIEWDISWPPILHVLEHYFGSEHLPRRGSTWAPVRCPFHEDRNASASVSEEHNIFFCHGCGVSTTGLGVIVRVEGVNVDSARSIAAGIFGERDSDISEGDSSGRGMAGRAGDRPRPRKRIPIGRRRRTMFGT